MTKYIGFSTINANKPRTTNQVLSGLETISNVSVVYGKKFKSEGQQLVIQDFVNALNIPLGQKVGQPGYGTKLWSFIFEPNTADTSRQIEAEIRRIAGLDPRMLLNTVTVYAQEYGILIEIEMAITPYNQPLVLGVFFDERTNAATLLS
jgi:phage baseplate assembly protein W